jgi:hypothetical protein
MKAISNRGAKTRKTDDGRRSKPKKAAKKSLGGQKKEPERMIPLSVVITFVDGSKQKWGEAHKEEVKRVIEKMISKY